MTGWLAARDQRGHWLPSWLPALCAPLQGLQGSAPGLLCALGMHPMESRARDLLPGVGGLGEVLGAGVGEVLGALDLPGEGEGCGALQGRKQGSQGTRAGGGASGSCTQQAFFL